jgi:thiosulfate/3-mercaptopyruvate sulfurtransferase
MQSSPVSPLVSVEWLKDKIGNPDIQIFDCSYHLPTTKRNAAREYEERYIPGAQYFDIDQVAALNAPLPHTLPSLEEFGLAAKKLGLGPSKTQIFYDNSDLHSAARGWWMLRQFGFKNVFVLDGGLQAWIDNNGPLASHPSQSSEIITDMPTHKTLDLYVNIDAVKAATLDPDIQVIDARSHGRFTGIAPEPRPGLSSGHMESATNLPYQDLFDENGFYKDAGGIREIFKSADIDMEKPIITSCGSGITACTLALALAVIGKWDTKVYDGSWLEWALQPDAEKYIRKSE